MRLPIAIDHRLRDLGLQREHALDPLRRDIVALVVDDDVLLPVGDNDAALLVEVADVAGRQPAVLAKHARGLFRVAPIAVHDELASDDDFAIFGDLYFRVLDRRTDRFEANAGSWAVAANHRTSLGLAVALKECDPE